VTRIGVAVAVALFAIAGGAKAACRDDPALVAPCYPVRGRLFAANGAPSLRIWPVGTRRLLGVHRDAEPGSIPDCLRPHVGFDRELYADFVVCPFTRERAGHMRFVCVASAANMTVRDATGEAPRRVPVEGTCASP
jgi:hypothetical protein